MVVPLQDPSIKQMAEQIAQDPAFAQMTAALQASVAGDEAGASGVDGKAGDVPAGGPGGLPTMDAEKYAQAMSNVLQNQHFMEMAEKLGQQIMSVSVSGEAAMRVSCTMWLLLWLGCAWRQAV